MTRCCPPLIHVVHEGLMTEDGVLQGISPADAAGMEWRLMESSLRSCILTPGADLISCGKT